MYFFTDWIKVDRIYDFAFKCALELVPSSAMLTYA